MDTACSSKPGLDCVETGNFWVNLANWHAVFSAAIPSRTERHPKRSRYPGTSACGACRWCKDPDKFAARSSFGVQHNPDFPDSLAHRAGQIAQPPLPLQYGNE